MLNFNKNFRKAFQFLTDQIDHLSKPNADYIENDIQMDIIHKRNKAILKIQFLIFLIFLMDALIRNCLSRTIVQGIVTALAIAVALLTTCRFHHEVFRVLYNLIILAHGVAFIISEDKGVLAAWLTILTYPTFVYLVTGSIYHYFFHSACHIILMLTVYPKYLKSTFIGSLSDEFVQTTMYFTYHLVLYNIIFIALVHHILQNTYHHIRVIEKKKEEFERQKNFFLSFSHELRNLINSLMGNLKLAYLEDLPYKAKKFLGNADVCGRLLIHLVNNILDTGKGEIGDLEVNPSQINIYDTIERIWSVCTELIMRKNLKGRIRIQKDIPQNLILDKYRLTQIFLNLVGNAVKFTDSGNVDLCIEWIHGKETVDAKCFEPYPFDEENDQEEGIFEKNMAFYMLNDNFVTLNFSCQKVDKSLLKGTGSQKGVLKITVSDTGIGISKEGLKKLFRRFTQVTSDAARRKLGTGLGLFITKELCQRMNGEVKVFSKKGKGSVFIFCLPVEPIPDKEISILDLDSARESL